MQHKEPISDAILSRSHKLTHTLFFRKLLNKLCQYDYETQQSFTEIQIQPALEERDIKIIPTLPCLRIMQIRI